MGETARLQRDGVTLTVTLDRPARLNAFDTTLVDGLHAAMDTATQDGMRLVVFRGEGRGFSGGFDLDDLDQQGDGDLLARFVRIEALLQRIHHARFATLALVHGPCYGAAADLVAACQARIAAPDARFRMPGLRFGVVLGTRRLAALVGADHARALLLRDTPFDAGTALATGFVTRVAAGEEWPAILEQRLREVCALSAGAYAEMTRAMTPDLREADMDALVRSVQNGSIKSRIAGYVEDMRKTGRRATAGD